MKESNLIKTVNALFFIGSACLLYGLSIYVTEEHRTRTKELFRTKTIRIQNEQTEEPKHEPNPILTNCFELRNCIDSMDIQYVLIETEYIGICYITAYCPQECGYIEYSDGTDNFPKGWMTASGTICHYSENNYEPTTCAIDRNYFGFNELLMIDGKVYQTEDTGAFRGMWVDVFRPDFDSMWEHGAHYSEVYSVEYVTKTLSAKERKLNNEWIRNYLFDRCACDRIPCRNDR